MNVPAPIKEPPWYKSPLFIGVVGGVSYGLIVQVAARMDRLKETRSVMALGFVFLLPMTLGFLTAHFGAYRRKRTFAFYILAPQLTAITSLICAITIGWEGLICLILATPVYMFMGGVGGLIAFIIHEVLKVREGKLPVFFTTFALVLPPGSAFVESLQQRPVDMHKVHTEIVINVPREKVWSKIIRVEPITEPTTGVFYRMGFPKPIEASLSKEGVGGVRHARFEKDLVFIETVDEWKEQERLSFAIAVDPNGTPLTTLDEHVTVGGDYFDVMRGTYWIEPREHDMLLHLESEFRLSTNFNRYAGFWGDFLMRDIQMSILRVIKARCEK